MLVISKLCPGSQTAARFKSFNILDENAFPFVSNLFAFATHIGCISKWYTGRPVAKEQQTEIYCFSLAALLLLSRLPFKLTRSHELFAQDLQQEPGHQRA